MKLFRQNKMNKEGDGACLAPVFNREFAFLVG